MVRHALVTGATGGFGRILVPALLAAGYRVRATGRDREAARMLAVQGAEMVLADLVADPLDALVEGIDTVFHLAALSSPWGARADFEAINVEATRRLLDAARNAGVMRFVFASTPSIYAEPRDRIGLTEADVPAHRFANDYAATKYAAEQMVLAATGTAMTTVALRPRAIVGPHDTVLLPRLIRAVRGGRLLLPGGGKTLIELTDARDAAAAFIAADRPDIGGQVFNISGGAPRPLSELVATIFARLGRPVRITPIPRELALAMGGAMERVALWRPGRPEPPLTRYGAMTLGWSQTFNLARAREGLGWAPSVLPEAAIAHALKGRSL